MVPDFDKLLGEALVILETGPRLRRAIIKMKRGTLIEVDYFRAVRGAKGLKMLVAGIGAGEAKMVRGPKVVRDPYAPDGYNIARAKKPGPTHKLPDFYRVWFDDQYGWHVKSLFRHVLTMNVANIESIQELGK